MRAYRLTHLVDSVLLRNLSALVQRDRANTATLLAYIAEVDERRLYLPAGYPSMHAYCLGELHLSEDEAYKRIRAARTAREYPALFEGVAGGRLHLTAVCLLAPHLTAANARELIESAAHKCRSEVESWLAQRFPRADALRLDDGVFPVPSQRLVPGSDERESAPDSLAPGGVKEATELVPGRVEVPSLPTRLSPLSPERFTIQVTIARTTHDKLRYAQSLLGHAVPSGDVALVLDRALDSLIDQLEKRKIAAARLPRRQPRPAHGPRHVPAHVRREVWARDGGQCTFVGEGGHRCAARVRLEFDHIDPVARGGRATTDRIRLRCRGHNQFEADLAFGAEFMRGKRQVVGEPRNVRIASHSAVAARVDGEDELTLDVIAGLRALGMRADEARRAAEASRGEAAATIEERLRRALQSHRPLVLGRTNRRIGPTGGTAALTGGSASMQHSPALGP